MSLARQRLSAAEYLAVERQAVSKSEFFDGTMFARAGASESHNLIALNLAAEIRNQFKGRPCKVYASDMRVKVSVTGLYTYPDVTALCGPPRFEEDTLLNPNLIIEVLSTTTESYDRAAKFAHYRRLDSLTGYVLVAQDRVRVEYFSRQPDGRWLLSELTEIGGVLKIADLDCNLPLTEIYDRVEFKSDQSRFPGPPEF